MSRAAAPAALQSPSAPSPGDGLTFDGTQWVQGPPPVLNALDLGMAPGASGAVNLAAWDAAMSALPVNQGAVWHFPAGTYYFAGTLRVRRPLCVQGVGNSTLFRFTGTDGIWVQGWANGESSEGALLRRLQLAGSGVGKGLLVNRTCTVEEVLVSGFAEGVHVYGSASAFTNANSLTLDRVHATANVSHGFFFDGPDANAGLCLRCESTDNGGWGFWDSSFLGNTFVQCLADSNALGPYKTDDPNNRSLFLGCYSEAGQPKSALAGHSQVLGGMHGTGFLPGGQRWVDGAATETVHYYPDGSGFTSYGHDTNDSNVVETSVVNATPSLLVRMWHARASSAAAYRDTIAWHWAALDGYFTHGMAHSNGTLRRPDGRLREMNGGQFFTGAGFGLINEGHRITHRPNVTDARGPGPDAFMTGDVVFNSAPAPGAPLGWVCTAPGELGAFTETLTATADGTGFVTLSAPSYYVPTCLRVGMRLAIGATVVDVLDIDAARKVLAVTPVVPPGTGLTVAFAPPIFVAMGTL